MLDAIMTAPLRDGEARPGRNGEVSFREQICWPFLLAAQNPDGGWGYRPNQRSAVEPTSWTLLELASLSDSSPFEQAASQGMAWLLAAQLPDGSWPAYPDQREGCWTTALAGLVLHMHGLAPGAVAKGFDWLCNAWPGEGSAWRRLQRRLFVSSSTVRQNHSLRGWSWTPGTSSWVEPTAYALILLHRLYPGALPPRVEKRRRLAEAMLYDRMCPGGGWNSGNPFVYGVAGEPLVGPTVWALLALQDHCERAENQESLDWLARTYEPIRGPASLVLAHMCLQVYGRRVEGLESTLRRLYAANGFLQSVSVTAWAAMALGPGCRWLRWRTTGASQS
jgi:hypothetical protein